MFLTFRKKNCPISKEYFNSETIKILHPRKCDIVAWEDYLYRDRAKSCQNYICIFWVYFMAHRKHRLTALHSWASPILSSVLETCSRIRSRFWEPHCSCSQRNIQLPWMLYWQIPPAWNISSSKWTFEWGHRLTKGLFLVGSLKVHFQSSRCVLQDFILLFVIRHVGRSICQSLILHRCKITKFLFPKQSLYMLSWATELTEMTVTGLQTDERTDGWTNGATCD